MGILIILQHEKTLQVSTYVVNKMRFHPYLNKVHLINMKKPFV